MTTCEPSRSRRWWLAIAVITPLVVGILLTLTVIDPSPDSSQSEPSPAAVADPTGIVSQDEGSATAAGDDAVPPAVEPVAAAVDAALDAPSPVPRDIDVLDRDDPLAVAQNAFASAAGRRGDTARFSAALAPEPFDPQAYETDPQSYLTAVDARRLWQTASDASGAAAIELLSSPYAEIAPGGSYSLRVRTEPGAPVSAVAEGMGCFRNGLPIRSLAADADGVATFTYTATRGVTGLVVLTAASPLRTDHASVRLRIRDAVATLTED